MEGTNNSDKLSKFNLNEITKTTPEKIDEIIDKNESIDSIDNNSENLDFLQNMLSRTKSLDFNQNNQETLTPRKTILSNLARCSNIMKNFTVEELEITIDKIHLKAEDEKTEKEKELEVLEQIGMNCIYSRDSFKNINFTEKQIKYKEFHNKIIIGNLNWIKKKKEEDEDFFNKLSKPQKPKYLVIACSDSRVVVNEFTATEPGDVFTHRNIGNLIGLNFDRVWEGTMSDIYYDPSICRNVMVDIRYVLFIIDKYAGANNLIEELKLVHPKKNKVLKNK